jgi:hypothetical protein
VFDEDAKWDWSSEQASSEFIIDYVSVTDPAMVTVRQEGAWNQDSMSPPPSLAAAPPRSLPAVPQPVKSPPCSLALG